jgi:hypothetical protein
MGFWKRFWAFLRNETTLDEKVIEKVAEVKKEVIRYQNFILSSHGFSD